MAGEDEDITIDLKLRDYLTGNAATAAHEMEQLADNTKQAARALLLLDKRADKAANTLYKLAAATAAANGGMTSLNKATVTHMNTQQKAITTQQSFQKGLQNTTKREDEVEKKTKVLTKVFQVFTRGLKLATAGLAMMSKMMAYAGGAAIAGQLGQQLLGVVAALTSLISFAALVPIALGGAVVTVLTAKMAFKDLKKAITEAAHGDASSLLKLFKDMGPGARKYAKELASALKTWKDMQKSVQQQFLQVINSEVPKAIRRLEPIFRGGMRSIATEFGLLVNNVAQFFNSSQGERLFGRFFQAGTRMIAILRKNIGPFLDALSQIVEVAWPYWNRFLSGVSDGFSNVNGWLERISQNGQLKGWLDTAFAVAKNLWGVLKDLGGIIKGVIQAAGGAGEGAGALGLLGAALGIINKWANSLAGQQALTQFFSAVNQIATALTPIITMLANVIGTVLAPAIANIIQGLAPGFVAFLQAFANALQLLAPYIEPLGEALGQILIALVPLMGPLSQIAILIAQYLVGALQVLAPILSTVATSFSTLLTPFLQAAISAFQVIMPYIPQFTDLFVSLGNTLAPVITQIADIFSQYFNTYLQELATEILPQLMPQLLQLAATFGEWLLQALQMLMPYMPQIAQFMVLMMERSAALWPIILQLATIFLQLATAMMPIGGVVLSIAGFFLGLANSINSVVNRILGAIGRFLGGVRQIPGIVSSAVSGVANALAAPFRAGLEMVRGIINDIKSTVRNMNLGGLVKGAIGAINPFRFAGGPVEGGKAYTVGEIGKEMWVGKNGQTRMIGTNGMDTNWRAPGSGMIVPNAMLSVLDRVERSMRSVPQTESPDVYGQRELARLAAAVATGGETHHWHNTVNVSVEGDAKEVDLGKIERAVNKALDKIEKDRKERRG